MNAARRFVLLRHEGHGPTHFDFMIEHGATLATWQLAESPIHLKAGDSLTCQRLADHRSAYLDYEGPVSGNRGSVHREDAGHCNLLTASEESWELELEGLRLQGRYRLIRQTGSDWVMEKR